MSATTARSPIPAQRRPVEVPPQVRPGAPATRDPAGPDRGGRIPAPRRPARTPLASARAPLASAPPPAAGVATVVCVDQYDLARHGVAYLARRYPDLRLVGGAATAAEAREVIARTRPAVVLVGDDLPDGGRALVAELRASHPRAGVVVVSHRSHDLGFPEAREAGAAGYVSRSAPVTALVSAIRHAASSPTRFRAFGVAWAVERAADRPRNRRGELSDRERQVLALVGDGLTADDIASTLKVGRGTVRTYLSRAYAKLQVTNRAQAVVAAHPTPTPTPTPAPASSI